MDRKKFIGGATLVDLTSIASASGATASTAAAAAAPTEAQLDALSNRNLQLMITIIQAVMDDLNQDAKDYGGHRSTAVARLWDAKSQLQQAIDYVRTHGS